VSSQKLEQTCGVRTWGFLLKNSGGFWRSNRGVPYKRPHPGELIMVWKSVPWRGTACTAVHSHPRVLHCFTNPKVFFRKITIFWTHPIKWMVYFMENPYSNGWFGGIPISFFLKHQWRSTTWIKPTQGEQTTLGNRSSWCPAAQSWRRGVFLGIWLAIFEPFSPPFKGWTPSGYPLVI
jgi:hypothetical protein